MNQSNSQKIDLFSDGLNLNVLNNRISVHVLRKSLRKMKKDFINNTSLKHHSDFEIFKHEEEKNIRHSIEKIQLTNKDFLSLNFKVNPYLVFTFTNLPENGIIEDEKKTYPIVLQPKFIALGKWIYVPVYLTGQNQNLLELKKIGHPFSGWDLVKKLNTAKKDPVEVKDLLINLLKKFMLLHFLIIEDD